MAFKRLLVPGGAPARQELTRWMTGIGMNFASEADWSANIEDTLLFASVEGMEGSDLRVLAILVEWLGVHAGRVNADRMTRLVAAHRGPRVRAFWSAIARWLGKDRRFARMGKLYRGPRLELLGSGSEFLTSRHGEDRRFEEGPLRVPGNVLRRREADVMSPQELARRHRVYRFRVLLGPSYRADMWALVDAEPRLSAAELARRTYGSFTTAWGVKRDWALHRAASLTVVE